MPMTDSYNTSADFSELRPSMGKHKQHAYTYRVMVIWLFFLLLPFLLGTSVYYV